MTALPSRLWSLITGSDPLMGLLWLGLAAFTVTLVVLIWTRWGQSRPLQKCLALSLLAHLLLAGYATTIRIVSQMPIDTPVLQISCIEGPGGPGAGGDDPQSSETRPPMPLNEGPDAVKAAPPHPTAPKAAAAKKAESPKPAAPVLAVAKPTLPAPAKASKPSAPAAAVAGPELPDARGPAIAEARPDATWMTATAAGKYSGRSAENVDPAVAEAPQAGLAHEGLTNGTAVHAVPETYKLRMAPNHSGLAQGRGGSPETEAAVQAALRWIAQNQEDNGRWDARRHGAGRESTVDGQNRRGAGIDADTGMTGLALLALLASGHTHRDGNYSQNVRRGLEYLLQSQDTAGSLSGRADYFARMYSHAMAAFALSEAYAMTGDRRLQDAVRRAIDYTVAAQDPNGGGWRYQPGLPGDTSQLGWQLMALKSAELAGIPIPAQTRQGIVRYLRSVSSGRYGGLASYRPREQLTRTMTAESLVCWQFLGLPRENMAATEAGDYLLSQLPGEGSANLYYWYYGTLAMYQLQGDHWQRWNVALRKELLATQQKTGPTAGTWEPDSLWGAYGGRVYSTALGALCLEVYYRYLPLYVQTVAAQDGEPLR